MVIIAREKGLKRLDFDGYMCIMVKAHCETDGRRRQMASSCDMCAHYVYDEEDDFYECLVNMDEDDFARFVARGYDNCPYFQLDDEYRIVRHQM